MRKSSSLLLSVLTIAVIMISTIASIVLFSNVLIANAQQPSQLITSQPGTPQGAERTFQSISDSFSVLVPDGWIIQDVNNTSFRLLAEVLQGYGVLAQLCPQEQQQQEQQALSNVSGSSTYNGSCQEAQEDIIHIIRYPNLGARLGFASDDIISTTNNITADDILAYQIQKLQEAGYRDIGIINNTDTTINVDMSTPGTNNNNNTISEARVPAKLVEMTYSTNFAPNETRTGYFVSTATDATPHNLGTMSGYSIFYEGNSVASASPAAETTTPSGSLPPPITPLPAPVRQVFDSFELIAAAEVEQAIEAEQQEEQPANPLTGEITSNGTEGVAPATFEFEASIEGGTEPYTINWDFDDGSEESDDEETVVHTFDEAGTYNVNLTITDSLDQIASDSIEITVEEPPTAEEEDTSATTTGTATDNDNNVPSTDATNGNENNNEVVVRIPQGASELTDDAYSPNPVEVRVGDTVTWINDDSTSHTATAGTPDSGSTGLFGGTDDSPEIIEPEGGTQSFTFDEAGEFPYYCTLHPNMIGTVIVTEQ
jgi:plastocyanin